MLIEVNLYSPEEKAMKKARNELRDAFDNLAEKHKFVVAASFYRKVVENPGSKAQILICTRSERDFGLAKDFAFWAFDRLRRKKGIDMEYEIKHIRMDYPWLEKGKGEE